MKCLRTLVLLLIGLTVSAQSINLGSTTRAVVIGISDYQNLPDLQFAHRDAEAFAAFLQSPAGGSLPLINVRSSLGYNDLLNKYFPKVVAA
jgi:hypothetical protein